MSEKRFLELVETIAAPLKQIFTAFGSSVALQSWFTDFSEVDFNKKGHLYCWWDVGYFASGLFTKIVENEYLAFTWSGPDEPHSTLVEVFFTTRDDVPKAFAPEVDLTVIETTEVRIRHSGIGTGSEWTERLSAYKQGWATGLANLKSVMETGVDKRLYDRPMLGIMPGDLIDNEKAASLGLVLPFGIILAGTIEGMGADEVGLQKGDIIVSINHHDLKDFGDLTKSIGRHKAGDEVDVTYYRTGKKHTVRMALSSRRIPEAPMSAVELAEKVGKSYAALGEERDALFVGVSDEEASTRPVNESWSAKETLVHMLYTERWLHFAISRAVDEQRRGGFVNQLDMIAAMAGIYSLEELLTELKRSEQITVAFLKALPVDFVADKRKFLGLVNGVDYLFEHHSRSHFDQIKAALITAKAG